MVERSRRTRGRPRHPDVLTPAEWRVAHAVRHGMSTRAIASGQGVSIDAVKYHLDNIRQKLGLDTRADLRLWVGVPAESLLGNKKREEEVTMTDSAIVGLGQVSRTVSDIQKAVLWYRDVLGVPHLYTYGNLAFFDLGGTRLFLTDRDERGEGAGDSILYLTVENIHSAFDQLVERGVVFVGAPHLIHRHESGEEEWMAFFEDLDGHLLALMSRRAPTEVG